MHRCFVAKLLIVVFLLSRTVGYAQESCEQTLSNALNEFNAGHFYGISAMLKSCIDHGFTKEQRQRAYLLLTQAYLLLDDPIGAEDSYLKLLRANPEFVAEPDREPIDVVYLSKKFTATPVFSLFGKIGSNLTFERTIQDWTITGTGTEKQRCYVRPGLQINGGFDWNINEKFALSFEAGYMFRNYRKEIMNLFVNDATQIIDRHHWINVPVSVKYTYNKFRNFKPYGYIGYAVNLLLADRASFTVRDRTANSDLSGLTQEQSESPAIKFGERRNFLDRSLVAGAGIKYKSGLNYLVIDIRYSAGLTNVADPKTRYYNYAEGASGNNTSNAFTATGISVFEFAYVDDDFRLDNLALTVGYIKPLYKPRKLKIAKTRTVMRKIKRQHKAK
jgi:hypothetical protein